MKFCVKFTQIICAREKLFFNLRKSYTDTYGDFDFIHQFFSSYIGRKFAWKDLEIPTQSDPFSPISN